MATYDTREVIAKLAEIDPELSEYLKSDGKSNPMLSMSFGDAVIHFKKFKPPESPTTEHEFVLEIPMRDGHQSNLRVHKPTSPPSRSPLVILIHGGGFCLGHNTHLSVYARAVAEVHGATVVNISYRLAPEFKFPTAPNDVWDSLKWLSSADNAQSLGADLSAGFVIGGVSAGANLAAVAAQKWQTENISPPFTGVWLSIPYLLEQEIVPAKYRDLWFSREQNAAALVINKPATEFVTAAYEPDIYSPDLSPFNAKDAHKGLPPVYLQVCGQDPLRDDGLIYEKVLRDNGVTTKLDVYPGVPHGHTSVFFTLKSSQKSNLDSVRGIGWLLGKDGSDEDIVKALASAAAASAS